MALLLQPGDPVPALVLHPHATVADFAGRYLLLVCGEGPLPDLPADVALLRITLQNDPEGVTARRLGVQDPAEVLAVLVDPAGRVLQSAAGPDVQPRVATALESLRRQA